MELILIVVLVLLLVGALPTWGYSRGWGYNGVGTVIGIALLVWLLTYLF